MMTQCHTKRDRIEDECKIDTWDQRMNWQQYTVHYNSAQR